MKITRYNVAHKLLFSYNLSLKGYDVGQPFLGSEYIFHLVICMYVSIKISYYQFLSLKMKVSILAYESQTFFQSD